MITPAGALTVLHSFDATDGATPTALVLSTDGNFYGATISGGANIDGTLFEITAQGIFTILHDFNGTDGTDPFAGLVQATGGTFDGTTNGGGTNRDGTVFSLGAGLGPFVKTVPTAGKVGGMIKILGTNLTGATTGPVRVTTPRGTLVSNVAFQVIQ